MISEPLMHQAKEPHLAAAAAAEPDATMQPSTQPAAGVQHAEAALLDDTLPALLQQASPSHSVDYALGEHQPNADHGHGAQWHKFKLSCILAL